MTDPNPAGDEAPAATRARLSRGAWYSVAGVVAFVTVICGALLVNSLTGAGTGPARDSTGPDSNGRVATSEPAPEHRADEFLVRVHSKGPATVTVESDYHPEQFETAGSWEQRFTAGAALEVSVDAEAAATATCEIVDSTGKTVESDRSAYGYSLCIHFVG